MKINYFYNKNLHQLTVPDSNLEIIQPNQVEKQNEKKILQQAIESKLPAFLSNLKKLLIIVNDSTRSTPTSKILETFYPHIKSLENTFLVATGSHKAPTETELKQIFGRFYYLYRDRIFCHDAHSDDMVDLGSTSRGTEVKINELACKADKMLIISSVEPHYFAGYTGGRKSILPGISSYKTIEQNHKLSLSQNAQILRLIGNPVHEDMMEAAGLYPKEIFAFLTVSNRDNNIFSAEFDSDRIAFENSLKWADLVYKAELKKSAEIVLAFVHPPLDVDLYQAHKGLENARSSIRKDGIFILIAACNQSIGSDNFYRLLCSCSDPDSVFSRIQKNYRLGYHKAAKIADFIIDHKLWMVSEIPKVKLEKIFISSKADVQTALDEALQIKGENANVLIIQEAGTVVPFPRQNCGYS